MGLVPFRLFTFSKLKDQNKWQQQKSPNPLWRHRSDAEWQRCVQGWGWSFRSPGPFRCNRAEQSFDFLDFFPRKFFTFLNKNSSILNANHSKLGNSPTPLHVYVTCISTLTTPSQLVFNSNIIKIGILKFLCKRKTCKNTSAFFHGLIQYWKAFFQMFYLKKSTPKIKSQLHFLKY